MASHTPTSAASSSTSSSSSVVGLFWDVENCSLPRGSDAFDIVHRIRQRLVVQRCEIGFTAYCDIQKLTPTHQSSLAHANVRMQHVPGGKSGAADRALWLDLDRFVLTHKAPGCTIVIISGDIDFVQKINLLRHTQGYEVIVVHNAAAKRELKESASSAHSWSSFTTNATGTQQPSSQQNKPAACASASPAAIAHTIGHSYSNEHHPHPLKLQSEVVPNWNCDRCDKFLNAGPIYACKRCQHYIHRRCFEKLPQPQPSAVGSRKPASAASSKPSKAAASIPLKPSSVTSFVCRPCATSFASLTALLQHQAAKAHWVCPACERKPLQDEAALKNHMVQKHSDQFQFEQESSEEEEDSQEEEECWECPVCKQEFQHEQSLTQHQDAKQHRIICQLCDRREFVSTAALEAHERAKHGIGHGQSSSTYFKPPVVSHFTSSFGFHPAAGMLPAFTAAGPSLLQHDPTRWPTQGNGRLRMGAPLHPHATSDPYVQLAQQQEQHLKQQSGALIVPDAAASTEGGKALLFACPQCSALCEGTASLQRHFQFAHELSAHGVSFEEWHRQQLQQLAVLVKIRQEQEAALQQQCLVQGIFRPREILPFHALMQPPVAPIIRGVQGMSYRLVCSVPACVSETLRATGFAEHYSLLHAPDAPPHWKFVTPTPSSAASATPAAVTGGDVSTHRSQEQARVVPSEQAMEQVVVGSTSDGPAAQSPSSSPCSQKPESDAPIDVRAFETAATEIPSADSAWTDALRSLSIAELKQQLDMKSVNYANVIEKDELVWMLVHALADAPGQK